MLNISFYYFQIFKIKDVKGLIKDEVSYIRLKPKYTITTEVNKHYSQMFKNILTKNSHFQRSIFKESLYKRPIASQLLQQLHVARGIANSTYYNQQQDQGSLGIDRTIENNLLTETNKLNKIRKKFWQNIELNERIDSQTIHIQMDSRTIRTPMGNELAVPKDQILLANLLKYEWKTLDTLTAKAYSLPLTSLISRCIDLESAHKGTIDPETVAKCNGDRESIIKDLLRYLDTDTLLVFSPRSELEGELRKEQDELYLPIIKGIEGLLYRYLPDSSKIKETDFVLKKLDSDIDGLRGNKQPENIALAATNYLKSLSYWNLAVFEKTVMITKSFICGIILCENTIRETNIPSLQCDVKDIEKLCTLETIHQVKKWGEVEDTHDVNKVDMLRNISAASIVASNHD